MSRLKPILAVDWNPDKLKFPVIAMPKYDGVRGINDSHHLTGRSLKQFACEALNERFNKPEYAWMDSEIYTGDDYFSDSLCRDTTSAVTTIKGPCNESRMAFDLHYPEFADKTYEFRLAQLEKYIKDFAPPFVTMSEWRLIDNMDDLIEYDNHNLERGAEGTIIRDPKGYYKRGRSTVNEGLFLRIKRFTDEEGYITNVYEAMENMNPAQINELGYTFRTSHKDNKIGAGRIGAMDVKLLSNGEVVRVSAGKLSHREATYYWLHQNEIIGRIAKTKHFAKGAKDTTRHHTFQCFRDPVDMS